MTTKTLETEIADKVKYLNDLKFERIARPDTKDEYIALLVQTEQELQDLITQNNQIVAANAAELEAIRQAAIDYAAAHPVPTIEDRMDAIENSFLDDIMSRLS